MSELLQGLPFERIPAMEGKTLQGCEVSDPQLPMSYENLSRYQRACVLSHRLAWTKFLETDERFACILEDDILFSPGFRELMQDESWLPAGAHIVKLETTGQRVLLARQRISCRDRCAAVLKSAHFGTAAYVISREGARFFLGRTIRPDRPMDRLMFTRETTEVSPFTYQIIPAPCIQSQHMRNGIPFSELTTSIPLPADQKHRKPVLLKLRNEIRRPFLQAVHHLHNLLTGARYYRVDFA
jgi:glycosyl transferase family 25